MDDTSTQVRCPGCSLDMPENPRLAYTGYYYCSKECWAVYGEVLGFQFSNAIVFRAVHQLTVDAYAIEHAGNLHTDKSIAIHLCGLHAAFNLRIAQVDIPNVLQKIAHKRGDATSKHWPHFDPPNYSLDISVFDLAVLESPHVDLAMHWAKSNWLEWSNFHGDVAAFMQNSLND